MQNSPVLYLIRGVPGSGKSSFADALFVGGIVDFVFEADHYFVDTNGVYRFDSQFIALAHDQCQRNAQFALNHGHSVAVSNTSTTEREVETYRKIAENADAKFVSIVVENRHGSGNIHNVPAEVVEKMKQRFSVKL